MSIKYFNKYIALTSCIVTHLSICDAIIDWYKRIELTNSIELN